MVDTSKSYTLPIQNKTRTLNTQKNSAKKRISFNKHTIFIVVIVISILSIAYLSIQKSKANEANEQYIEKMFGSNDASKVKSDI